MRPLTYLFALACTVSFLDTRSQITLDSLSYRLFEDSNPYTVYQVRRQFLEQHAPDECDEFGRSLFVKAISKRDSNHIARATFFRAHTSTDRDSSLYWMEKAEKLSGKLSFRWEFFVRQDLQYLLQDRGIFEDALDYGRMNLEFALGQNDSVSIIEAYHDIGYCFDRMMNYKEAIRHYKKAQPYFVTVENDRLLGRNYGLIGIAHDELREYDKAVEFNSKAIELFRKAPDGTTNLATWTSNIGNTYIKMGQYEKAEEFLLESLELNKRDDGVYGMSICNINLGNLYLEMGKLEKAKEYLDVGMRYCTQEGIVRFQAEGHNYLSRYFVLTGDSDKSIFHLKQYQMLNDSIVSADKAQQIADMQIKYETTKQIQANAILAQQNDILELQKKRQQIFTYGSLGLLVLTLISSFLGYRAYRNKQKNLLNEKLVRERERGLRAVLKSIEDERQRIAKDLHDGVGQQMTAIKLQYSSLKSKLKGQYDEEINKIGTLLENTGKDIRSVSHQMMPRALTELGLVPAIKDMLHKSLDPSNIRYHFEVLGEEKKLDRHIEIGLYRIAQELINNIVKHSKAVHVDFQLLYRERSVMMTVEDDGIGMKIGDKEGVGLLNITSRLNAMHGEARYENAKDHGTVAVIRIHLDEHG
ncbi:MAG: sensor histidine kinase [Flavobacteriales bacterium]|nr:sensor histidine kinase [Flavobacteriales bacterium]